MAVSGTLTQVNNGFGALETAITGITQGSSSPTFSTRGYPYSGAIVQGIAGAGAAFQWQASNDGGATWANIGASFSSLPANGTINPSQQPYKLFQLVVTSGDATTNVAAYVFSVGVRG